MAKILDDIEEWYEKIYLWRMDIATHTRTKSEKKATAWKDASSIKLAKEKEDFVKSAVAEYEEMIDFCEAEVEKAYNMVKLAELKLEHGDV